VNAANILHAAIGNLERRGRCLGSYEIAGGAVDPLGAMALGAGDRPDVWQGLMYCSPQEWAPHDVTMVAAARLLARVAAPLLDVDGMPVVSLVGLLGDWADAATDREVFEALAEAARRAESVPLELVHRAEYAEVPDGAGRVTVLVLDDPQADEAGCSVYVQKVGTRTPYKLTCAPGELVRVVPREAVAS
jgi:hypothetical protein